MKKFLFVLLISILSISCSSLQYANYVYEEDNSEKTDSITDLPMDSVRAVHNVVDSGGRKKYINEGVLYVTINGITYYINGQLLY